MIKFMYKIYHRYAHTIFFKWIGILYRRGFFVENIRAQGRLKKLAQGKRKNCDKIKVVFLCQYIPCWNKLSRIFEEMQHDGRFEVKIIAVPEKINNIDDRNYMYFSERYGKDVVIDAYKESEWYDIRKENADYVFLQRPYDQYLPELYRSKNISRFAKVLYVSYGYMLTDTDREICAEKRFFRNIYMYFAENSYQCKCNINRFKRAHKNAWMKTLDLGYPSLENFISKKDTAVEGEETRVLWTPRWTEDKEVGGSSFMKYKDSVIEYAKKKENVQLIFRPHPMMFDHFVSVGRLSTKDAESYINIFDDNKKYVYDRSGDYASTFWNTDILITDYSSIIVEYFLTEKPIIYCDVGIKDPDLVFRKIMERMYIVNSWDEVEAMLDKLISGDDPLKDKRREIKKLIFGQDIQGTSKRIIDSIVNDYKGMEKE